jgi:hypothetical protein
MVTAGPGLAWTALTRPEEGDTLLFLRRAEQLPVTNLWLWNGGRDDPPWSGQALSVVGVEDAICAGAEGARAALDGTGRIAAEGVATALPAGRHAIPHAIVRLPVVLDVETIDLEPGRLVADGSDGRCTIPFDDGHLR